MRARSSADIRTSTPPILAEPPFFIVGSGRSGTTLMRSLLSGHSRLTVTPETHFLKSCVRLAGVPLDRDPPDFEAFWKAYCATPRFAALDISPDDCAPYLSGSQDFATAFQALLRAWLDQTGKARVGEKTPSHVHQSDWLFATFPDARMIAMRRDPRAMIASQLNTPWRKGEEDLWRTGISRRTRLHAVASEARSWAWVNGEVIPELETDPRVLAVSYEELVVQPERTLRTVCAHLGEDFEPGMLARRAEAGADPSDAGFQSGWVEYLRGHEAKARAPVGTASLQKWRADLSPTEVAVIEAITGRLMQRFGYTDFATSQSAQRRALAVARMTGALNTTELTLRRMVRHVLGPAKPRD